MHLYPEDKVQPNTMTRPVKNYTTPTEVMLDVLIYAILDLVSCIFRNYLLFPLPSADQYQ